MGSLAMQFLNRTRSFLNLAVISIVANEVENLNLSGDIGKEFSGDNGLFPDTYQDSFGEIQPRIFIEEDFIGKEVLTSGRIELDENHEPFSKVTVISVHDELSAESWFDSFIKKLTQFFK